ncbi:phosphatidylinositol-4,5-bisphosphate 4-phosphatase [Pseudomonas sp. LAMO17WK12:I10]|uniref:inositol phosphate phosphatase SopB n=1 Tax=unclassified Pseudomonas TaxID=196821 RepID=UPI000BD18A31|nr:MULTISPECIES: inositol phosphate phosphatase SopB [unclassified Pseudomonas]PXX54015.1 phosphatidylinositol-4,5-bisphosphate 4-phosphatase [Pseudomonas sp. LAMO17WK12:I9]SNY51962.1 phosphatidylinositol-4,5-bisphosphate 4-phosphatase [Pseudomonas sp. LAMO17WK12:I10]
MTSPISLNRGVAKAPIAEVPFQSNPCGRVAVNIKQCSNVPTQLPRPQSPCEDASPFKRVGAFREKGRRNIDSSLTKVQTRMGHPRGDGMVVQPELGKSSSTPARSIHALTELNRSRLDAAALALRSLGREATVLEHLFNQLEASRPSGDREATKAELKATKRLNDVVIDLVASQLQRPGVSSRAARREALVAFRSARQTLLNEKVWNKVHTGFEHGGRHYACTMVPAAQMKLGNKDVFAVSYLDHGVCSSSIRQITHATNLWTSEIRAQEPDGRDLILFKGVRHGTLSPYGLEEASERRHLGAANRAREVVTAALFARPELLSQALAGHEVTLRLVSTSLLTGGLGGEGEMLRDQMLAWRELCQSRPLVLSLMGGDGERHAVRINLDVAAFNFGVNEFALNLHFGHAQADGYNATALRQLLGDDLRVRAKPGGWVGEYLGRVPAPANADRVRLLSHQLKEIWASRAHHQDAGEPYKAAQRAAMLAFEIGAVPCWNCKSGKDRTGMLDVEIKREAAVWHQGYGPSAPGSRLTTDHQQLLHKVILNGGNKELQEYNTWAAGNKVMKKVPGVGLSYDERVGNRFIWNVAQGLSPWV